MTTAIGDDNLTVDLAVQPSGDPFWACPDHGTQITYARSEDWQERWECPVADCEFGRWIS